MNAEKLIAPLTELFKGDTSRFSSMSGELGSTDTFVANIDNLKIRLDVWGTMWKLYYNLELTVDGKIVVDKEITGLAGVSALYRNMVDAYERWKAEDDKAQEVAKAEKEAKEEKETDELIAKIKAL